MYDFLFRAPSIHVNERLDTKEQINKYCRIMCALNKLSHYSLICEGVEGNGRSVIWCSPPES